MVTNDTTDTADGGVMALRDWRRQVTRLYQDIEAAGDPGAAWAAWRATRDRLMAHHPQSPFDASARAAFQGLTYFRYDTALRFSVAVRPIEAEAFTLPTGDGATRLRPFARTHGLREALGGELTLYWILDYGGGVFLPFADATSGQETYGAGRYLLDTIKGADLGGGADSLTLDFNFAYNPSCSYSARWVCPLAPAENRLPRPVRAGERL